MNKYNETVGDILNELFDTGNSEAKWHWDEQLEGYLSSFEFQNQQYEILLSRLQSMNLPNEEMDFPELNDQQREQMIANSWYFEFIQSNGTHHDVTGNIGTSSSKVFSMVYDHLKKLMDDHPGKFNNIYFAAQGESRTSLYRRLAPRLAKALGKQCMTSRNNDHWLLIPSTKTT